MKTLGLEGVGFLGCALLLLGCGESVDGTLPGETTLETWRDYCVATFTHDYVVLDHLGEVDFAAKAGDEYLVQYLDNEETSLVHIGATGPYLFDVVAEPQEWVPLTSTCQAGSTTRHVAVFSDITVFADRERTTPICSLAAGTTRPYDTSATAGYVLNSTNGQAFFEIWLNAFSEDCDGAESGYVEVSSTWIFEATSWLSPIITISGPL
jgi:hypothetical protein